MVKSQYKSVRWSKISINTDISILIFLAKLTAKNQYSTDKISTVGSLRLEVFESK